MLDLAQHENEGYVSLKKISERQSISMKYLEAIVALLNKCGMVESLRGKEGGYRLVKEPEAYTAGSIVRCAEGSLVPVACLECEVNTCKNAGHCLTLPMWKRLDGLIGGYLDSVTLRDLLNGDVEGGARAAKSCAPDTKKAGEA